MIRITRSPHISDYAQIARELRLKLVNGDYKPGEQLPTVRELAEALRLNHNTVAAAYRLLAAEGWID
ncbi:MAG TPA: winged helix-turn-helix domain-containing protein, partial [Thermoanaerobaculia bacterium]